MRFLTIFLVAIFAANLAGCGKDEHTSMAVATKSSSANSMASSSANSSPQLLSTEMDVQVKKLMQASGATAVTVAIAKNGQIQYEQAYGFQDANKTIALKTDALMRTASIVKPVTAAAIRKLDANGVLSLSDHVFCNGTNAPCWLAADLLSATSDIRAKDITIKHLIAHQGGWYRELPKDPITEEPEIRDALKLSGPPTREDIVRYVMKLPLDYTPGAPDYIHPNYTNFGYLLLGMIIEKAAHTSYIQYVQTEIMAQLGINASEFKVAEIKPADRDAREPIYISTEMCPSVFTAGKEALCADEGADLNNWVSAVSIITTARTMALFAQHYRLPIDFGPNYGVTGESLVSSVGYDGMHDGIGPGINSIVRQLPSGISYAIFLNARFTIDQSTRDWDRIAQLAP